MDINLPGISGIEAMKILRADPSTAHIPIIALSANAMPRDIEKGLEAGFFSYLTKPIKVERVHGSAGRGAEVRARARRPAQPRRPRMMIGDSDILNARILIVDDQEANVALARADAARGRLHAASPRP